MLNAFYAFTQDRLNYSEACLNILENLTRPVARPV